MTSREDQILYGSQKHGVLGKLGAMRVLDYNHNNNDFKLTADDVKRLEIIAKPRRNATEK